MFANKKTPWVAALALTLFGCVTATTQNWVWDTGHEIGAESEREPASEINVPGGLIKNGPLKAEGAVGDFTLPNEVRMIPQPMNPLPLTYAHMNKDEIAITIDDGPSAENNAFVLKTLKDHGVKATFFLVGHNIQAHPEIVKNILRAGHTVGVHTWSHPVMTTLSLDAAAKEIDSTNALLQKIAKELNDEEPGHNYHIQPFFRFPYGKGASVPKYQDLLKQRNMANFFWSMTTKDSETQDGNVALNTTVGMLEKYNHGILLMHETHIAGVKALPYVLEQLHNRNYKTIMFEAAPAAP